LIPERGCEAATSRTILCICGGIGVPSFLTSFNLSHVAAGSGGVSIESISWVSGEYLVMKKFMDRSGVLQTESPIPNYRGNSNNFGVKFTLLCGVSFCKT
jgi:hypothetical protein